MTSRIELAVSIPQTFPGRPVDVGFIRRYLARAEALGFHSAWVVEQVIGAIPSLEPVELLTYAAAVTTRMRLGSAVLLTALRDPVHTAKSLTTLDHLCSGRLMVGVGLGGQPAVYPAYGLSAERRAERFAEGIEVMKRLWTEPRVTFDGQFFKLKNLPQEPKPVQKPHPPLWFGAHHPNALKRTVELGDAFMGAGSLSTAKFAEEVKVLRDMLTEAKRDAAAFPIAKRVYIAVDRDKARAGKRLTEWFGGFYGRPQMAEEVSVWGPPEECVAGLQQVIAAGAGMVMLNPVFDDMEHLEIFASEIAPKLSS
ncbi:MAG TPA: LLM class flavin-dependent oxidoreductase [Methylomirabilota bacterium]